METFSADGKFALVTTYSPDKASVIDTNDFKEISSVPPHPGGSRLSNFEFSPDGKYMAGVFMSGDSNTFRLWDINTGKQIRTFSGHSHVISALTFTPDGKRLLSGSMDHTIKLWNVFTGKEIKTFKGHANVVETIVISANGELALSGSWDNSLKLWDIAGGKEIRTFKGHTNHVSYVSFSPDGKYVVSASKDGTTRLWDIATGKEIAQFISFTDGEWIVITPEGYYNASANGDKYLNVRVGNNVYGIENYREAFFRPDLVKVALSGGSLKDFRKLADVKQPPFVSIVDTPESVNSDETTVKLRLTDNGGGIGDIRLYLNGTAVVMDSRAVTITPRKDKALFKEYTLKLTAGKNIVKAVAFNGDNTMQSNDAVQEVTAAFAVCRKTIAARAGDRN